MTDKSSQFHKGFSLSGASEKRLISVTEKGIEILKEGKPILNQGHLIDADVVFVIDTTGSMNNEIQGLIATCQRFANAIAEKNIDYRMGIVGFGDLTISPPDKIVKFPLINNPKRICQALSDLLVKYRTSGGGNLGESSIDALWIAADGFEFRKGAVKVFLLFTDEPPLEPDTKQRTIHYTIQEFKRRGILCFCITDLEGRFKRLAKETNATWFPISSDVDFLSILDQLFATVIDKVERIALAPPPDKLQQIDKRN